MLYTVSTPLIRHLLPFNTYNNILHMYAPRRKRCPIFLLFHMSTTDGFRDGEHTYVPHEYAIYPAQWSTVKAHAVIVCAKKSASLNEM
jgi:hypothetical protein